MSFCAMREDSWQTLGNGRKPDIGRGIEGCQPLKETGTEAALCQSVRRTYLYRAGGEIRNEAKAGRNGILLCHPEAQEGTGGEQET